MLEVSNVNFKGNIEQLVLKLKDKKILDLSIKNPKFTRFEELAPEAKGKAKEVFLSELEDAAKVSQALQALKAKQSIK